jgi:hypothetical protein
MKAEHTVASYNGIDFTSKTVTVHDVFLELRFWQPAKNLFRIQINKFFWSNSVYTFIHDKNENYIQKKKQKLYNFN